MLIYRNQRGVRILPAGLCLLAAIILAPEAQALEAVHTGFKSPTGMASGQDGALYITNWSGGSVEKIAPDGTRTVFLGDFTSPSGIAVDNAGAVYVASYSGDYIERVGPDGKRSRVVENLATPAGLSFSSDGSLLIANRASGEVISLNLATGEKRSLAGSFSLPVGVVEMPDKSLVVSQYGGGVTRVMPDGTRQELGQSFVRPGVGILTDGPDAVIVVDNGASILRRVTFDGRSSEISGKLPGSAVALARDHDGNFVVGTWGTGGLYRIAK